MTCDWWWHFQKEINEDFGFNIKREKVAQNLLTRLSRGRPLENLNLSGKKVVIVGADLSNNTPLPKDFLIAADGAVKAFRERNHVPDIVVSDLDGYPSDINWATRNGAALVIHGHGDNLSRLIEYVPKMNFTTLTSTYPSESLDCWGGFTDGDRSILMALSLGAASVSLLGFSFDSLGKYTGSSSPQVKKKKLHWAKRIIFEISSRYDRFKGHSVL